jgi:hypothetical protein
MNRAIARMLAVALLGCAGPLDAQHHGGGGKGGSQDADTTPPVNSKELQDFMRAMALQASPDQASRFQTALASLETARRQARAFLRATDGAKPSDIIRRNEDLLNSVDEARFDSTGFLKTFSSAQKNGLKEPLKKLQKADAEVGRLRKLVDQEVTRPDADRQRVAAALADLQRALEDFRAAEAALGANMGIEVPAA